MVRKKKKNWRQSWNHETIERFTNNNVIHTGILSSDLQLVLSVKRRNGEYNSQDISETQ